MTKIGQAAQSTGWIISSQSRDQAVQSTGWIISVQSQFFRSCFLRTSPWGCWGPLTYRWWSGSGSTLGSCPAVSWGSSEPTMYEFSRDGGIQKQANQVAWNFYFRPCNAKTIYFSPCSAGCPPSVHAEQRCPTPVHPMQKDVYEEFLKDEGVTKDILEDVTKEVLEEKKMGATLILTQPSLRSGCVNLLLGLIPTQTLCTSGSPMLRIYN